MAVWNVIDRTDVTSGGVTYYDKSSISASYDHLCLHLSLRADENSPYGTLEMRLNADSGTNYSMTFWYMVGTVYADQHSGADSFGPNYCLVGDSAAANTFSPATIWIPNYSNTANFKQVQFLGYIMGTSNAANQYWSWQSSGLWQDTSAINQIQLSTAKTGWGTVDFMEHSSFTLYGINGA